MFCVLCGSDNPEKARYCWKCGAELVIGETHPADPPVKRVAPKAISAPATNTSDTAEPNLAPSSSETADEKTTKVSNAPIANTEARTAETKQTGTEISKLETMAICGGAAAGWIALLNCFLRPSNQADGCHFKFLSALLRRIAARAAVKTELVFRSLHAMPRVSISIARFAILPFVLAAAVAAQDPPFARSAPDRVTPQDLLTADTQAEKLAVQGRVEEVVRIRQTTLQWALQLYGPNHASTGSAKYNLANAYMSNGQFDLVEPLLEQSRDIFSRSFGPDSEKVADTFNLLAVYYGQIGQHLRAVEALTKARNIYLALGNQGDAESATFNIATTLSNAGRTKEALQAYAEILQQRRAAFGETSWAVAKVEANIAAAYTAERSYAQAEQFYTSALATSKALTGSDWPTWSAALAWVWADEGRLADAERLFQDYAQYTRSHYPADHPEQFNNAGMLARISAEEGHWDEALSRMERNRHAGLTYDQRILGGLADSQQLSFLRNYIGAIYDSALSFGVARFNDRRLVEASAGWLANGKGLVEQALAERVVLLRERRNPQLTAVVDQLREVRRQLSNLIYSTDQATTVTGQIGQLQDREDQLTRQLRRTQTSAGWIELSDIRRSIPAGAVLVDFARISLHIFGQKNGFGAPGTPHYLVWIIPALSAGNVQCVDLGLAARIDAGIKKLQDDLQRFQHLPLRSLTPAVESQEEGRYKATADELAKQLIEPLMPAIGATRTWIVSPDADLWYIPWATLWVRGQYLIERHKLDYVTSSRQLVRKYQSIATNRPVIMADPDFDAVLGGAPTNPSDAQPVVTKALMKMQKLARLYETAAESESIMPSLQAYTKATPLYLHDKNATKSAFEQLRSPSVIELSTHGGFFKQEDVGPLENPLLRGILALAGANRSSAGPNGDNGYLTGEEVLGVDLEGTSLVVLNACETGLGDVDGGQAAAGLREAFELAGARTVVATLWTIPAKETVILMDQFFGNLSAGHQKGEALWEAQNSLLDELKKEGRVTHPYYWGTFTLTGDAR